MRIIYTDNIPRLYRLLYVLKKNYIYIYVLLTCTFRVIAKKLCVNVKCGTHQI